MNGSCAVVCVGERVPGSCPGSRGRSGVDSGIWREADQQHGGGPLRLVHQPAAQLGRSHPRPLPLLHRSPPSPPPLLPLHFATPLYPSPLPLPFATPLCHSPWPLPRHAPRDALPLLTFSDRSQGNEAFDRLRAARCSASRRGLSRLENLLLLTTGPSCVPFKVVHRAAHALFPPLEGVYTDWRTHVSLLAIAGLQSAVTFFFRAGSAR